MRKLTLVLIALAAAMLATPTAAGKDACGFTGSYNLTQANFWDDILVTAGEYLYSLNPCQPLRASPCSAANPNVAACQAWGGSGGFKVLGSAADISIAAMKSKGAGVVVTIGGGSMSASCGKDWETVINLSCDQAALGTPTLKLMGTDKCVATFSGVSAVACPITPPEPPIIPDTYSFSYAEIVGASPLEGNTLVGAVNVDTAKGVQRVDRVFDDGSVASDFYVETKGSFFKYSVGLTPEGGDPACTKAPVSGPSFVINPKFFDEATLEAEEDFRGIEAYQWKLATSNATFVAYAYVSATSDPYLIGTQTLDAKTEAIVSEVHIFGFVNQLPSSPSLFTPPPMCDKKAVALGPAVVPFTIL